MKTQPNSETVGMSFVRGTLTLVLAVLVLIYSINHQRNFLFISIILFFICFILISRGIYLIFRIKYLKSLENDMYKATCTVYEYLDSYGFGGKHPRHYYYIVITYTGKSDITYKQMITCLQDDYKELKEGTEITCYIKDEDCYVPRESFAKK